MDASQIHFHWATVGTPQKILMVAEGGLMEPVFGESYFLEMSIGLIGTEKKR